MPSNIGSPAAQLGSLVLGASGSAGASQPIGPAATAINNLVDVFIGRTLSSQWVVPGVSAGVAGSAEILSEINVDDGVLSLDMETSGAQIVSISTWSLVDSSIYVQFLPPPAGSGTCLATLQLSAGATGSVSWATSGVGPGPGTVTPSYQTPGGSVVGPSFPFAGPLVWVRIRELHGVIYWDAAYSPYSWINVWSVQSPFSVQNLSVLLTASAGPTEVGPPVAGFACLNGDPDTTFTDGVLESYHAWTNGHDDAAVYMSAVAAMFEEVHQIVAPQGDVDSPGTYRAGYSSLLDVNNCDDKLLPFLSQFNGTAVPPGTDDGVARLKIQTEAAMNRGTVGALIQAAKNNLIGTQSVQLTERTNPNGTANAYSILLRFLPAECPSVPALTAAVEAQKPAGIQITYLGGPTKTWNTVTGIWNSNPQAWSNTI